MRVQYHCSKLLGQVKIVEHMVRSIRSKVFYCIYRAEILWVITQCKSCTYTRRSNKIYMSNWTPMKQMKLLQYSQEKPWT